MSKLFEIAKNGLRENVILKIVKIQNRFDGQRDVKQFMRLILLPKIDWSAIGNESIINLILPLVNYVDK